MDQKLITELGTDLKSVRGITSKIDSFLEVIEDVYIDICDEERPVLTSYVSALRTNLAALLTALGDDAPVVEAAPEPAPAPAPEPVAAPTGWTAASETLYASVSVPTSEQTVAPHAPSNGIYPILGGVSWYRDEDMNGDANDIFQWVLQADPMTCPPEVFIRGLLLSRKANGKGGATALTQPEIIDMCLQRAFTGWPLRKSEVSTKVKELIASLKSRESFDAPAVKNLSKNFITLSYYAQDQFELISNTRSCNLPGEDLDGIFTELSTGKQSEAAAPAATPNNAPAWKVRLGM